jgi:hypothetical protein
MIGADLFADLSLWTFVVVGVCALLAFYLIGRNALRADLHDVMVRRLDDEEAALAQRRKDRAA